MKLAGQQLLAGAGLPANHHGGVGGGDSRHDGINGFEPTVQPDDLRESALAIQLGAELIALGCRPDQIGTVTVRLQAVLQPQPEILRLPGLEHIIVHPAALDGGEEQLAIGVRRQQHAGCR